MYSRETVFVNVYGLHTRPATKFFLVARGFNSEIKIKNLDIKGDEKNAKSLIEILSLCAYKGTKVNIIAEGPDEEEAVDSLIHLINEGLE